MATTEILLGDNFEESGFANYDAIPANQAAQLPLQRHTDVRCFVQDGITVPTSMLDLNLLDQDDLNQMTQDDLQEVLPITDGEDWTAGTVESQADRNQWDGISLSCTTGGNPNTTQSVTSYTVDISAHDYVSVAMPNLPITKLTLNNCYIDISSDPTGAFTGASTDSIAFSQSSPALFDEDGDSELRIPISLLVNADLTKIKGIRFRLHVTASCTFRAVRIRACSTEWVYAPIDINTLYHRAELPPTPDGRLIAADLFAFPTTAESHHPRDFPILFRADDPPSVNDPAPIDAQIGVMFQSGSLIEATDDTYNQFALYFRETTRMRRSQGDLNGLTQAAIKAEGQQPNYRAARSGEVSWVGVRLRWNDADASLTVENGEGLAYAFNDVVIEPNEYYFFVVQLVDTDVHCKIYHANEVEEIYPGPVFDSGNLSDVIVLRRQKGRFGWWASLADGDAFLTSVQPRTLNYGSVVTKKLFSDQPVVGAQLIAGSSSNKELVTEVFPSPWGGDVQKDGGLYTITNAEGGPLQGVATNQFLLDDLENTVISFDIKFPASSLVALGGGGSGVEAFLQNQYGRAIPINMPFFTGDRWEHIRLPLANSVRLHTGPYRLIIVQTVPDVPTVWHLNNFSIQSRTVSWFGRNSSPDAESLGNWTPFLETTFQDGAGALFEPSGNELQLLAKTNRQNAQIHEYSVTPKYAELGRFVWISDLAPEEPADFPEYTIGTDIDGGRVTFTAESSSPVYSGVVRYQWSIDDRYRDYLLFGPEATYTFAESGTYTVLLTVISSSLQSATTSTTVTVTVSPTVPPDPPPSYVPPGPLVFP